MNISRCIEKKRRVEHTLIRILLAFTVLAMTACETTGPESAMYPNDAEAKKYYAIGANYLEDGDYKKAEQELRRSIEIESGSFIPHARLATAYYAQQKFFDASATFERATELTGGPQNGGAFTIMQALSLMRGGKTEQARKLLEAQILIKETSSPNIVVTGVGSYFAGSGRAYGVWKTAAGYLLVSISEQEYLERTPQSELSFPYLFIGINSVVENDRAKAHENLTKVISLSGRKVWRGVIARAELNLLEE